MNCRPGDLACIVGLRPSCAEAIGRIVRVVRRQDIGVEPAWLLAERVNFVLLGNGIGMDQQRFFIGQPVYVNRLQDKYLRPLRDRGDDAVDETIEWAGRPVEASADTVVAVRAARVPS